MRGTVRIAVQTRWRLLGQTVASNWWAKGAELIDHVLACVGKGGIVFKASSCASASVAILKVRALSRCCMTVMEERARLIIRFEMT